MLIGVPKEIKVHEYRVGLTPGNVRELTRRGHKVMIETNAGREIGFDNKDYTDAGAKIVGSAQGVFAKAEMIVKVKEPQAGECKMLNEGQVLFTYLHLAPDPKQTNGLLKSGAVAIAYETVTDGHGQLPLLAPMSEVAGRMAAHVGAHCLEKASGGRGVLLGGVPGVAPAKVVVIGGGVVGTNAAVMAMGLGAEVVVLDNSTKRLAELDFRYAGRLKTIFSTASSIEEHVTQADLVVGAVLIPGAEAPKLVTRKMIKDMPRGSVIVDVAIDQGGCFATSKATTHANPTYVVDDVVHYCVANMPGGVARTSTLALNNATLPYTMSLAEKGYRRALHEDPHLRNGLNVHEGKVTYEAVARGLGHKYYPPEDVLAA
jgi:alanine dehydrogenase